MRRNGRFILLSAIFLTMALLIAWLGWRRMPPSPPSLAMDDWNVPKLVAHLRKAGVEVHTLPCQRNDVPDWCAYLSVTQKEWSDVNGLSKSPILFHEWRGIVYCARESSDDAADLATQWGDRCLRIGPFICYGDADLLARIGTAVRRPTRAESS
jgi:hypothetical protein